MKVKGQETVYSLSDYMAQPQVLDTNPDIIKAAFLTSKTEKATVDEAKQLMDQFMKKEVQE